ncbi:hypothetical protein GOP47_0011145 [Adiantum capillus-veneris]|uniref:Non-structural maintenance of chromosomes element 4 n=1 Tax=Adiantum capillus-veneris TaxID=13818 RepID=A0A9D4ZGG0_ADICA|nr:hypothetical protein GOP47_0011145 [Adiantum capillus-veneris]
MSQRRGRHAAPSLNDESEDVKAGSVSERRVLRSHYRCLKASIAEGKEQLLSGDSNKFDEIVRRADDLYTLVHRPREQIADAEALLDITEAFLNSVKESRRGNAVKASDLVSAIIQNFRQPANLDDSEIIFLDWAAIGSEATCIFHDAPGLQTMLGPMDSEPKKRKAAAARRRERGPATETARPETVGDEEDKQSQTDKNIRTMFNVLRRCGEGGCELEQLVLSRDSFSHTVENIFSLSFLVKDGRAQITIQDGKQFVAFRYAPTAAERAGRPQGVEEQQQVVNTQFVFRFDFKDWILMKEMVEQGAELMPKRSQQAMASQAPSTPIRKNSRNRGRTSSEPCELTIELGAGEDDSEGQADNDDDASARSKRPMKRRMLI